MQEGEGERALARLKKRYIYLISMLVLIGLFHALAGVRTVMDAVASAALEVKQRLGLLCAPFPFSMAELLCSLGVLLVLAWLVWTLVTVCRGKGRRWSLFWRRLSLLLAVLLTLYLLLCLLLGAYGPGYTASDFIYGQF